MSAGGGSVPGNTAVKQEGNISGEVSEGLGKEKEHSRGWLFPSMQHRTKMRGVQDDVSQPPPHPTNMRYYTRYRARRPDLASRHARDDFR